MCDVIIIQWVFNFSSTFFHLAEKTTDSFIYGIILFIYSFFSFFFLLCPLFREWRLIYSEKLKWYFVISNVCIRQFSNCLTWSIWKKNYILILNLQNFNCAQNNLFNLNLREMKEFISFNIWNSDVLFELPHLKQLLLLFFQVCEKNVKKYVHFRVSIYCKFSNFYFKIFILYYIFFWKFLEQCKVFHFYLCLMQNEKHMPVQLKVSLFLV